MMITYRPDRGLRSVAEIMEDITMDQSDNKTETAAKLKHCQSVEIAGGLKQQCPYLVSGGRCGFQHIFEGPNNGRFPTLAEVETCPAAWAKR